MDTLRVLSFLMLYSCAWAAIRIKELQVPEQLQYGKVTTVILDCKYEVDTLAEQKGLVIQWFFNEKQMIYQWFPGMQPTPLGIMKDRLDLNYIGSTNSNHKYIALKITNVTTDLTGEYTCKVANYEKEASQSQMMIVYEPPKAFHFESFENASMLLCSAFDIFPKPVLNVYANGVNFTEIFEEDYSANDEDDGTFDNEVDADVKEVEEAYGFYNVTKSFRYELSEITEPIEFVCEVTIPNTDYSRRLSRIIIPEGETTSTTEIYDYETTTTMTTPSNSPVVTGNFAPTLSSSKALLSAIALVYLWRHL